MGQGFSLSCIKSVFNNNDDGIVDNELSKDTEGWNLGNKGKLS